MLTPMMIQSIQLNSIASIVPYWDKSSWYNGAGTPCMKIHVTNTVFAFRTKKNITQEELATSVGVTRQTIIAIEKGNYTPSVELALKVAQYFGVTVEQLFRM